MKPSNSKPPSKSALPKPKRPSSSRCRANQRRNSLPRRPIEDAPAAYLPVLADTLKSRWQGVAILAAVDQGKVALLCSVSPAFTKKIQAGKIIQAIAPLVGGKGGGRPELAQGGGANPDGVAPALAKAEEF